MQLITFLSAAAATVATASAAYGKAPPRNAIILNQKCDRKQPHARIVNRCDYPVNLWSIVANNGCDKSEMVTLKTGESYNENYEKASELGDGRGVSIKISKTDQCKGNDITQLEYYLDDMTTDTAFQLNYLDVSYVDCLGQDCPGMKEGYYLRVGTKATRAAKLTKDNSWCPIQACDDPASCALISYIMPNDVQTKTCDFNSNMEFYLCGSESPSADDEAPASPAPASPAPASSKQADKPTPKPTTTADAYPTEAGDYNVKAAAVVTPAAVANVDPKEPKVKTKIVYVTATEYVNVKRSEHAHAHARRHQAFHA